MLNRRQRTGYLVLAVFIGHVILISAQVNVRPGASVLEAVTFGTLAEVQRFVVWGVHGVRSVWSGYVSLQDVREENVALRETVAQLELRLQQQNALAQRAHGLQQLLEPGPRAAKVQLLIDRNAAAGALIERTRAAGVVLGVDDESVLRMDYVSNLEDVRIGDSVVTSGTDGIYPKGFVIGTISAVERGIDLYKSITVEPIVDFSSLEDVLVVMTDVRLAQAEGLE